jgi:hypothetical protein
MTNPSIDWAEFNKRKPLVFNVVSSVLNSEILVLESLIPILFHIEYA